MNSENKYPLLDKLSADAANSFLMPEGYFTELNKKVNTQLFISDSFSEEDAFNVPDNYFNDLHQKVNTHISISNKENAPVVPEDYFNKLSANIFAKIEAEEQNATPILNTINKQEGFNIPENYFESLSDKISKQTNEVKIISINRNKSTFNFTPLRWAAIAIIILASGWFIYNNVFNYNITKTQTAQLNESFEKMALQELDEESIIDYLAIEEKNVSSISDTKEKVNEEEILQNIDINDLGEAL